VILRAWYPPAMRLAFACLSASLVVACCAYACACSTTHAAPAADPDAGGHVRATPEPAGDGGTGFCATHASGAAFCDDFDDGKLGAAWDFVPPTPPGIASLDVATFLSAPASLGVVTETLGAAELGSLFLRKTVKGTASRAVLGFDFFADDAQPDGTLAIATLDLAIDHLLTLYLRDDDPLGPGAALTEAAPGATATVRNPLAKVPPPGTWTRIELDVDAAMGRAIVRVGGAVALTTQIAKAAALDPTIRIGALVSGPAAPYSLRFDDVTLDLVP
jgi:hypothetical protein